MGGTLRNFCTGVSLQGARGWSARVVVCGCGQARCWVVGEQAHTLVGVCGGSSSAAVDCHSLVWGWWSGCVVVVVDL